MDIDPRRSAPAVARNRDLILSVLRDVIGSAHEAGRLVLEIASGTGEHIVHFAAALPGFDWQPSDADEGARASIAAWVEAGRLANVRPPLALDARDAPWPVDCADAILCINMIHISPPAATTGLLTEAGRLLPPGGPLILYGPFMRANIETAPSNLAFDADLRRRDPHWGLRDLEAIVAEARCHGLSLERVIEMPANNLSVILRHD